MSITLSEHPAPTSRFADEYTSRAARRMYDAEVALHIARQTGVAAWVSAAYDRLHDAIIEHTAALAAQHPSR